MPRSSISHIALTVSDLDRSTEFYDKIFKFMGQRSCESFCDDKSSAAKGRARSFARKAAYSLNSVRTTSI
jgi:predicted enzyme related to lactoylglutathione lyase